MIAGDGRRVVALEGHDGSGKTTLARRLAHRLDAVYVRPYGGPGGAEMLAAAEAGDPGRALAVGRALSERALRQAPGPRVVCDRLWMTVFTLVPEELFARWGPRAPTALCWADAATTLERLARRPEPARPAAWHRHYLGRYLELAERFACPVIRTDELSEDEALEALAGWACDGG